MSNRIIICETSEIITTGLYDIIQGMAGFDVVARIDTPENLSERIVATDANLLIINQNILCKEHPQLTVIALVTSYIKPSLLKPYDGIIEISDTKLKIINKLNQFAQDIEKQDKTEDVELSKREIDVLVAVAKGMMNKEIADSQCMRC